MALNNHVKWGKSNLERHPFCFLCKRKEVGIVGRWKSVKTASSICTELKRSSQAWGREVALSRLPPRGTPAALSLFFLGLSLDVRQAEGSWDFSSAWRAWGGCRQLRVCVFRKAFGLIVYSGSTPGPRAATQGYPDASSWGLVNRPYCPAHRGPPPPVPTQAA